MSESCNSFIADPAPLERRRGRRAVLDAKGKAELYAETAGVPLGPLVTVSDGGVFRPQPERMMADMSMRAATRLPGWTEGGNGSARDRFDGLRDRRVGAPPPADAPSGQARHLRQRLIEIGD